MLALRIAVLVAALLSLAGCGGVEEEDPLFPRHLALTGTGYEAYVGATLSVALVSAADGTVVFRGSATVPASGEIGVPVPFAMAIGFTYTLDTTLDASRDGACDAPPTDPGWRVAITDADQDGLNDVATGGTATAITGDVVVVAPFSTDYTDVCATF